MSLFRCPVVKEIEDFKFKSFTVDDGMKFYNKIKSGSNDYKKFNHNNLAHEIKFGLFFYNNLISHMFGFDLPTNDHLKYIESIIELIDKLSRVCNRVLNAPYFIRREWTQNEGELIVEQQRISEVQTYPLKSKIIENKLLFDLDDLALAKNASIYFIKDINDPPTRFSLRMIPS